MATVERLVHLDNTRSSKSEIGNISSSGNVVASRQSRMAEATHGILVEGELGSEANGIVGPLHIVNVHGDRQLLASSVGQVQTLRLAKVLLRLGEAAQVSRELQRLVLRLNNSDGLVVDQQGGEDGQCDLGEVVGARARDDEGLEGGEGEGAGDESQEGRLGGDALEEETVGAVLLAFLADDGGDDADGIELGVLGEDDVGVLESAEDDGSKSLGEGYGVDEVVHGELVLAGRGGKGIGGLERGDGCQGVELLLLFTISVTGYRGWYETTYSENSLDDSDDSLLVISTIAMHTLRNIVQQRREVRCLKQLVEGNQLERRDGIRTQVVRQRTTGELSTSFLRDIVEALLVRVRKAIVVRDLISAGASVDGSSGGTAKESH